MTPIQGLLYGVAVILWFVAAFVPKIGRASVFILGAAFALLAYSLPAITALFHAIGA